LNALAEKLGHVQARLTRLDALGERVATMAGVEVQPGAPLARARAGAGAATPGGGGAAKAAVVAAAGGKVAAGAAARGDGEGADDAGKGGPLLPDQGATLP